MRNQMTWSEFVRRVRFRLNRFTFREYLWGLLFSRKLTTHGITVVTGPRPFPKVINEGGAIHTQNCQFYAGVRLEIERGATLLIGNGTYLNRNTLVHAGESVHIGKDCKISWDVVIMDTDGHQLPGKRDCQPVIIEDEVWIGCRSIILKGVHIGRGAVVAAGSVVTKSIPAGAVVGGVPARILRQVTDYAAATPQQEPNTKMN